MKTIGLIIKSNKEVSNEPKKIVNEVKTPKNKGKNKKNNELKPDGE